METLRIQLTGDKSLKALKELEHKKLIRIVREPDLNSYALEGKPITEDEFKSWVEYAENSPQLSLNESKLQWEKQKKKLQEHSY